MTLDTKMLFLLIKFKNTLLIKLRKDLANKAIQEEEIIAIGDKTKEEIADLLGKIEIETRKPHYKKHHDSSSEDEEKGGKRYNRDGPR